MKRASDSQIGKLCRDALDRELSDSASLKIRAALDSELDTLRNAPPKPIMTLAEVAGYLRISPESLETYLGDIPCFELGGSLLFRREAVDEWIRMREKSYTGEVIEFDSNRRMKFTVA